MRAKESRGAVRWTEKNRIYLERLGLIDGRSGFKRTNGSNISNFINTCVTMVLESQANPYKQIASPDDLATAWIKFNIKIRSAEIEKLGNEMVELSNHMPLKKKKEEALINLMEK